MHEEGVNYHELIELMIAKEIERRNRDYEKLVKSIGGEFERRKQSDRGGKFRGFEEVYAELAVAVVLGGESQWCRDQVRDAFLAGKLCAENLQEIMEESRSEAGVRMLDDDRVRKEWEIDAIERVREEIDRVKADLAKRMNEILARWEGRDLGNLAAKERLCSIVMDVADRLSRVVECQRCGRGARIRASRTLKEEDGQFQFAHTKGHRTTHQAGAEVPLLKLIEENE